MGPCDFYRFGPLTKRLAGKRFETDVHAKQAVTFWLQTRYSFFYAGLQALIPRWDKYLNVKGDYLEVWCVPSATYISCIQ
jgi:hypothetical protein